MGNTIYRTPCSYNSPCLWPNQFDESLHNNFQGDYKVITSGLTYDNWEADNSENTNCEYQGLIWTCTSESVKDNFYYVWKEQTKSEFYISTANEKSSADKFSSFMIGHQISTAGTDTGVCFTHSVYGAVCLLQDSAGTGMDTYRLTASEWTSALSGTEAAVATAVKNTAGALQDKTATDGSGDLAKTEWMDYYNCRKQGTNSFECAAFQPENSTDGVSQGYPRFGSNESAAGYLGYVRLMGASSGTASVSNDWSVQYNNAHGLIIAAAASAMAFLAF